jgi:hypothetical protein
MHVEMHQHWAVVWVSHVKAGFFARFAKCTFCRRLTRFDVTTGLQPDVESFVQVQHHASLANDYCRPGDVRVVGVLVKR